MRKGSDRGEQAEAEVLPSSSLVEVKVELRVEVKVKILVEVGVEFQLKCSYIKLG